jgi:hypothetical protein
MDTEGARALAARIAAGPPGEDGDPKPETPQDETPREPKPAAAPESAVEIVYLKQEQAPRHEVRIYVRGRDGSLERQP